MAERPRPAALVALVTLALAMSGPACGGEVPAPPATSLRELGERQNRIRALLEHFADQGIVLEKEILHDGQVVDWVMVRPALECLTVKTSFRAYADADVMRRDAMRYSAASVVRDDVGLLMFLPWAVHPEPPCEEQPGRALREIQTEFVRVFRSFVPDEPDRLPGEARSPR